MQMSDTRFQWHPGARLHVGNRILERPASASADGFMAIAARPLETACAALGDALLRQAPFCIGAPNGNHTAAPGAFLTLTGGTSGAPKVLRRSQASWIASFRINADRHCYTENERIAVLGGLEHSLALYGALEALHLGHDAYILAGQTASAQSDILSSEGITALYATPTQLRLLSRAAQRLTDLRLILCGGGMLDPVTRAHVTTLCPNASLHVFYGAAETSFITLSDARTPEGSVGAAYPGVDLQIDADGLIWVQSPYLFDGYVSGQSLHTRWKDGFLSVGEIGELDGNGNLFLRGRAGRMITVADRNVFLDEVETALAAMPGMPCTAVLAIPDTLRGHALVVLVEGPQDGKLAARVRAFWRDEIDPFAMPKRILFIDEFPVLPSGKTDLARLEHLLEGMP